MEPYQINNPKELLRANKFFCTALLSGVILFLILSVFLKNSFEHLNDMNEILLTLACSLSGICLFIANKKYREGLQAIHENNEDVNKKLVRYRNMLIVYYALCEAPALFAIIAYLLTGLLWFLLIPCIMIGSMVIRFPSTAKVISDLELEWSEMQQLQ